MKNHAVDTGPPDPNHGWDRGWEEHELNQLRRMAALPLSVKIAWLEDAHRIVLHLAAGREAVARKDNASQPPEGTP